MRQKIIKFFRDNEKIIKYTFISVFVFGLVAHGFIFFNKISYHDDVIGFYSIGATISSGRWMLYLMREAAEVIFGSSLYSIPVFNGLFSLLILFGIVLCVIKMLDIKRPVYIILVSGCLVTFPQVTSMFGYMFTSPYYLIGTLLGVVGVYVVRDKKTTLGRYCIGVILAACSVGTYQANLAVVLSLLTIVLLRDEIIVPESESNAYTIKQFSLRCAKYILFSIVILGVYIGIEQAFLVLTGEKLNEYQNINTFGMTSLSGYFDRIISAYKEFFWPSEQSEARQAFPFISNALYKVLILIYISFMLLPLFDKNKGVRRKGRIVFLMFILPLACNFIFVMCDTNDIHSVMIYGLAMFFPAIIMLLEYYDFEIKSKLISLKKIGVISGVALGLIIICFVRYSNICYLKAEIVQSQFVSYANNLIMRIEETDGYEPDMMIAYIGEDKKLLLDFYMDEQMYYISSNPYQFSSVVNDYAWRQTMSLWCGFNPYVVDYADEIALKDEVRQMPIYPMAGSIKVVDDILVVKFAEENI